LRYAVSGKPAFARTVQTCRETSHEQQNRPIPVHDLGSEKKEKNDTNRSDARSNRRVLQRQVGKVTPAGFS